ncbi:MAG: hypothetical protein Q9217_000045 [Psora testacea]
MHFEFLSLAALTAITILLDTSAFAAGDARHRHRRARSINAGFDQPGTLSQRGAADPVQISMDQLQSLQSYTTNYHYSITAWFNQQPADSPSAAQLKQQYQQFDALIGAWLSQAMGNALPSSLPGKSPAQSASPAGFSKTQPQPSASKAGSQASPSVTSSASPIQDYSSTSATASALPQPTENTSSGSSEGSFNPQAYNNVAVYWGGTAASSQVDLAQTCQDPNVNIINIAFLTNYDGPGGYPKIDFGPGCGGQSPVQQQKGATGLLYCEQMAQAIESCQKAGKKFLLSMGGSAAEKNLDFKGDEDATKAALMMSNLFADGRDLDPGLRPFGSVKLDGFDVDNESHSHTKITTFVKALRQELNKDTSKIYYITAAPQCVRPDESIPLDAMQIMDFVWVQFYNNVQANCNVDQPGFAASFKAWANDLSANGAGPKLYIGAPGCGGELCAGSGYAEPDALPGIVQSVQSAKNLGGIMLWDGPRAKQNTAGAKDYLQVAKGALSK